MDIGLDVGNSALKVYEGINDIGLVFQSGVYQLTPSELKSLQALNGNSLPDGFIQVNNAVYAVGEQAESYSQVMVQGGDRYTPNYYGVAMCFAITQVIQKANELGKRSLIPDSFNICGLMPPRDYAEHQEGLSKVGKFSYRVKTATMDFTLKADSFIVRPEPLAGYCHARFTDEMRPKSGVPFAGKPVVIIDVGGFTTDIGALLPDGQVNWNVLDSETEGIIKLLRASEKQLRTKYKGVFGTGSLPRKQLETFLQTGVYPIGGFEGHEIADSLLNGLSNKVARMVTNAGGQGAFSSLLLTGGGGALLQSRLRQAFPYFEDVVLAERAENIQFANACGAFKMLRGYRIQKKQIKARGQ